MLMPEKEKKMKVGRSQIFVNKKCVDITEKFSLRIIDTKKFCESNSNLTLN